MRRLRNLETAVCVLFFLSVLVLLALPAEAQDIQLGDRISILGSLEVSPEEVLKGNAVNILGSSDIKGPVDGDVVNILGSLSLDSSVAGDIISVFSSTELGPNTEIRGEVISVGRRFEKDDRAMIRGGVSEINIGDLLVPEELTLIFRRIYPFRFLTSTLIAAAVALLIISFLPGRVKYMSSSIDKNPWRILLIGFIGHMFVLFSIPFFAITIIGLPISFILPILLFAGNVFGFAGLSLLVGKKLTLQMKRGGANQLVNILLGLLILRIARGIPVLGFFVSLILIFISFGVVLDTKFGSGNPWFKKKEEIKLDSADQDSIEDDSKEENGNK